MFQLLKDSQFNVGEGKDRAAEEMKHVEGNYQGGEGIEVQGC